MTGYGDVGGGYGLATGIGVLLVLTLVALAAASTRRRYRRRSIAKKASSTVNTAAHQGSTGASPARRTPQPREASTPGLIRKDRIALLIAEGLVIRERLAGDIDAATYQSRMHELACGRRT